MRPGDTFEPDEAASAESGARAAERLIRLIAGLIDLPIAVCFTIEGEQARRCASGSDLPRDGGLDDVVPSRRLKLERSRIVSHVGRGPAAPEVALFSGGTTPLAVATLPIFGAGGAQIATVLLADVMPRPDLAEPRRAAALEELRALVEAAFAGALGGRATPPPAPESSRTRARKISSQRAPRPDPLTGLPDRTFAQLETQRRVERARATGQGLCLAIVSLDRFRRVNESLGHAVGDVLLRQVAQRLLASVDDDDLVARRSGDEFIVVFGDLSTSLGALQRSDRIQQAIREPFHVESHEIMLSTCIGMALFPDDAHEVATLQRFADIALHHAKDQGPGRLRLFDKSMQQTASERLDLEHQLREAMRSGQLSLHYQPKYSVATRQLIGAEALLRWKHPTRGMISPGRFIPVAEDSGLIVPIGTWALNEVARQCKQWMDRGLEFGRVSVNVSGLQFVRHDFVGTVRRAVRAASLPPERLELELTETVVMGEVESAIERLTEIRKLGVRVSVDDFGTGYSSLSYLQKLPVDVLKIDRSFVQELDGEGLAAEQARSLAQAITFLGHQLGLEVLAEGVETPAQLEQLANVGCDEVQGFLFARPMPAHEFEKHVRSLG